MSLELQNEVLLREASDDQKTETLKEQAYQLMHQALKEMQEAMLTSVGRRLRIFESVNTLAEGLKAHRHRVVRLEQRLAAAQRLLATRPAAPPSPPPVLLTLVHAPRPLARPARSYSQDHTHQPAGAAAPSPACCGSSSSASCGGAAWPWARGRGARVPPPPEENEHLNEGAPRAARRPPPFKVCALSRELLRAAGDGAEGAVRALLARGADVRWRNASRWTPLHAAARGGHVHVLALLLRCGADVCARTRYGYTALHLAAYNDARGACVRRLVRAGAPLDAANRWGRAPLHAAAAAANLPAALTLVAAGADRAATDHQGKTPFALAASDVMRGLLLF